MRRHAGRRPGSVASGSGRELRGRDRRARRTRRDPGPECTSSATRSRLRPWRAGPASIRAGRPAASRCARSRGAPPSSATGTFEPPTSPPVLTNRFVAGRAPQDPWAWTSSLAENASPGRRVPRRPAGTSRGRRPSRPTRRASSGQLPVPSVAAGGWRRSTTSGSYGRGEAVLHGVAKAGRLQAGADAARGEAQPTCAAAVPRQARGRVRVFHAMGRVSVDSARTPQQRRPACGRKYGSWKVLDAPPERDHVESARSPPRRRRGRPVLRRGVRAAARACRPPA